jgi:hypothetical protein
MGDTCDWTKPNYKTFVVTKLKQDNPELTCRSCDTGQEPNADHSACVAACNPRCAKCDSMGQVCYQCDFADSFYNISTRLIAPFQDSGQFDNETVHDLRRKYKEDKETDGLCQPIPSGVSIDHATGEIILLPGFSVRLGSDHVGDVWSVFACPAPENCPGGAISEQSQNTCANGHHGPMCRECEEGSHQLGSESGHACAKCGNWFTSVVGVNFLRFSALVALSAFAAAVVQIWEYNTSFIIRILKRGGVWSTLEVFIGFCQIATLFVSVTAEFDEAVQSLQHWMPFATEYRQILNVLSLNVPAWLSLECLLFSFYAKWAIKAVGVPTVCFLVVMIKHRFYRSGRQCCRRGRLKLSAPVLALIAKEQRLVDIQVAMFLAYTSVFNSVLHVMLCRQISPTESVLDVNFEVPCDTLQISELEN